MRDRIPYIILVYEIASRNGVGWERPEYKSLLGFDLRKALLGVTV